MTRPSHEPSRSGAGFQPAAGASSPRSDRGQDARKDRLEACPTNSHRFMVSMRDSGIVVAPHEPDRGCVVFDQPQHVGTGRALRLVCDTAAIQWRALHMQPV